MKIEITNETAADVAAIRAVTISAFLQAQHTSHTEQLIVDALRVAEQLTVSLVAKVDDSQPRGDISYHAAFNASS
jgi:putative acetyltransferase